MMRIVAGLFFSALMLAGSWAEAAGQVGLTIQVIEASRKTAGFPKKLDAKVQGPIKAAGFKGAVILDEVKAKAEKGTELSVRILKKSKTPKNLKVRVLQLGPGQNVKLKVDIPEFKFSTETQHKDSGTYIVAMRQKGDTAMFLAIKPGKVSE